jgi:P27 family predicted phage terminase small subunit
VNNLVAPAYLDDVARAEFDRVVMLRPFRQSELSTLASYCQNFAAWQREQAAIDREGAVLHLTGSKGQPIVKANPRVVMAERAQKLMLRASRQLGLHRATKEAETQEGDDWNPFEHLDDTSPEAALQDERWTRRNFGKRSWNHDFDAQLGSFVGPGYNESREEHEAWKKLHGEI